MKKRDKRLFFAGVGLLLLFVLWTVLVRYIDVQPIGPRGSSVGFAGLNKFVHGLTGVNMSLYNITDWLGLVPIAVAFVFAILGLIQWIKRKKIWLVDYSILVLGGFYIIVISVYILFEMLVINYRPVLINGYLEASYPSSTTMLVMCVMPTAIMQLNTRIKRRMLKNSITFIIVAFIAFMVIGRLISGVHWISDIIGGSLISASLVMIYHYVCGLK